MRTICGLPGEPAAPETLAQPKPFGVRHEREIVNRDDRWNADQQWRRIGRCEEYVEAIGLGDARQPYLLPPN